MTNDISVDTVTHDSAELAHTPSSTTLSSQSDPPTDKTTDSILNHTNGNGSDHTGDVCNNQDHLTSATHNKEADEMCLTQAVRFNETPLEQKLEEHYYRMQMQMDSLTTLMRQCVEEINGLVRALMEQQIKDLTEQYRRGLDEIHEMETNQGKALNYVYAIFLHTYDIAARGSGHSSMLEISGIDQRHNAYIAAVTSARPMPLTHPTIFATIADKIRSQMISFVQAISNSYAQIFQNSLDG